MTLEHVSWAMKQDIKGAEYKVLLQLANRCDHHGIYSAGQEVLVATTGYKERAVREAVKKLRELDLLHTERQRSEFGLGRGADIIILHPYVSTYTLPDYVDAPEEIELLRRSRALNETTGEWGVSPSQALPAKNAGRAEGPVDNFQQNNVSPSQTLPAENAGKVRLTGKIPSPTGTTVPVENEILPVEPLIGNARVARALKGNLLTDLTDSDQSINQSSTTNTGAGAREEQPAVPVTDGLTEDFPKNEICGTPSSDFIRQLRAGLHRYRKIETGNITDHQLFIAAQEILSRVDTSKITKPIGFCINAFANEPGGVQAVLEAAHVKSLRQQETTAMKTRAASFCDFHGREYTGTQCPLCSNPRFANLPGEQHEFQNV